MEVRLDQKRYLSAGGGEVEVRQQDLSGIDTILRRLEENAEYVAFRLEDSFQSAVSALEKIADQLGTRLRRIPQPVSDLDFRSLYDPNSPTLGIFLPADVRESLLFAVSAARLLGHPQHSLNIVFMAPGDAQNYKIVTSEGRVKVSVSAGALIGGYGEYYLGQFPAPVLVDAVSDFVLTLDSNHRTLEQRGLPFLGTATVLSMLESKILTRRWLQANEILTPTTLYLDQASVSEVRDASAPSELSDFLTRHGKQGVVTKPDGECGGKGVSIHAADSRAILAAVKSVTERYGHCLVEERIQSFPCRDLDGQPVDWNARILALNGEVLGMEVRVSAPGMPGNVARGARVIELAELATWLTGAARPSYQQLYTEFSALGEKISASIGNAGLIGLDIIWDVDNRPWVIEVNGGAVGGAFSLFALREGSEKLMVPKCFVQVAAQWVRELADTTAAATHNSLSHRETPRVDCRYKIAEIALLIQFIHRKYDQPGFIQSFGVDAADGFDLVEGALVEHFVSDPDQQSAFPVVEEFLQVVRERQGIQSMLARAEKFERVLGFQPVHGVLGVAFAERGSAGQALVHFDGALKKSQHLSAAQILCGVSSSLEMFDFELAYCLLERAREQSIGPANIACIEKAIDVARVHQWGE